MWYSWIVLLLVCCALVEADVEVAAVVTTRAPPRTLDRKADELAWHSWLQDPENENQNATHRRITTKSLFITPLVCPKGQRLDRNGCVQIVTVHKDEHERILVDQLNSFFTSAPNNGNNGDDLYDYGDEEQGPLQLTIPIGQDPQGLQIDLAAQAQNQQPAYAQLDKKGEKVPNNDANLEAELELLKLQQTTARLNRTGQPEGTNVLSHNVLNNLLSYSDKPKRDSPLANSTEDDSFNSTDKGQEELVFGHVNIDPVLYNAQNQEKQETIVEENKKTGDTQVPHAEQLLANKTNTIDTQNKTLVETIPNTTMQSLKAAPEQIKLSPENEYSDIDEAIKLISRYADVSTDDNFAKDNRKQDLPGDDSVLGTRTKLQYRRNKPKISEALKDSPMEASEFISSNKGSDVNLDSADILRYPWPNASPPPDYPFRHLQDYWPGRNQVGGVYNSMHGNPRRHHHSYPHYFRPRAYTYTALSDTQPMLREPYPRLRRYSHKVGDRVESPTRLHAVNQDLYSLLGLRHWFGSEGASKR